MRTIHVEVTRGVHTCHTENCPNKEIPMESFYSGDLRCESCGDLITDVVTIDSDEPNIQEGLP